MTAMAEPVQPRPDGHGEQPFTCADASWGCGLHTLDIRDRRGGWQAPERCRHPQELLHNERQPNDEYITVCKCGASSDGGPWLYPCDELCHIDFDSGQPDHSYACEERNEPLGDEATGES